MDRHCGLTEENVFTINNAIDLVKIQGGLLTKERARAELGIDCEDFVFGNIGRLVTTKGQRYLLNAFKMLHANNPELKLVIIGGGKLEGNFRKFVSENGLVDSVRITGEVFDAFRLMKAFDVFVLPSLGEAFGLVLLEAMIAKTPIIATNVGGIPSVLPANTKFLNPGDAKVLYQAMKAISQKLDLERQSVGKELYQHCLDSFSIETYREQYKRMIST